MPEIRLIINVNPFRANGSEMIVYFQGYNAWTKGDNMHDGMKEKETLDELHNQQENN